MNLNQLLSPPLTANEKMGKLNADWILQLQAHKYFKLFVPKALGGLEFQLNEAQSFLVATARFNGSLGWVHNLVAGANFFCSYFEEEVAKEIFEDQKVMCSGSGTPNGQVKLNDQQMLVQGSWDKCTGAEWATHFTGVGKTQDQKLVTFICPAKFVQLEKAWHGFGMKATSTNQIQINKASLPVNYKFQIGHQKSFPYYSIAQIDFEVFARICMSFTWLGLAHGILDQFEESTDKNQGTQTQLKKIHIKLTNLSKLQNYFAEKFDKKPSLSHQKSFQHLLKKELNKTHKAINLHLEELIWSAGLKAIDERNHLNWAYRNLKVANQHYFI